MSENKNQIITFLEDSGSLFCGDGAYLKVNKNIEQHEGYGVIRGVMCGVFKCAYSTFVFVRPVFANERFNVMAGDKVEIITNDIREAIKIHKDMSNKKENKEIQYPKLPVGMIVLLHYVNEYGSNCSHAMLCDGETTAKSIYDSISKLQDKCCFIYRVEYIDPPSKEKDFEISDCCYNPYH